MTCPEDVSRYSIALYYFSEEQPKIEHPVVFMKGDLKGMDLEEFSQDLIFGTSEFGTRN
jgi:hypothetical protein